MINDQQRPLDDIKREYATVCGEAGDVSYMIQELKSTLQEKHESLFKLKKEYLAREKEEQERLKSDEAHPFSETKTP